MRDSVLRRPGRSELTDGNDRTSPNACGGECCLAHKVAVSCGGVPCSPDMSVLLSFLFVGGTLCHGWSNKCERITIPMCQDIGYNLTGMPNLMGQEDQMQADRAFDPRRFRNFSMKKWFLNRVISASCGQIRSY
uniref:Uncharacterized protein n=1 Tax=Timema cristinae TaxID=61476 RepID=A0A7R9CPZ6_TIMCR|nr:unnamed protein product [Timema cristinae]